MGLFSKNKSEKFLNARSARLVEIIKDCQFFGSAVLITRPHAASNLFENYVSMTAKYYLKDDGLIYLWAKTSFDEFGPLKVEKWGFGFDSENIETIYLDCIQFPWLIALNDQTDGDANEWFKEYYKLEKGVMK
jgi:hypothetical protein